MQKTIRQWADRLGGNPLPVLARTTRELEPLVGAPQTRLSELAAVAAGDPGLAVQLLRMANSQQGGRLRSEITTLEHALMLLGTERLRALPASLPAVERVLRDPARHLLLRTFARAYHAAAQAAAWARQRHDQYPDEAFAAAQLHFVAEMVLAMHGPEELQQIAAMRRRECLPQDEAEYLVLGFTLNELALELARRWHLPTLVVDALQAEKTVESRTLGVVLAVQLARAAEAHWYAEDTRTVLEAAAEWLHRPPQEVASAAHRTAVETARASAHYGVIPAAAGLLWPVPTAEQPAAGPAACLIGRPTLFDEALAYLRAPPPEASATGVLEAALRGLHEGLGLNRVVFALLSADRCTLQARAIRGSEDDPRFNRFTIRLEDAPLFRQLLDKPQGVWMNAQTRARLWPLLPAGFDRLVGTDDFCISSVFVGGRPIGVFYADRHSAACHLDAAAYRDFRELCRQAGSALEGLGTASA